MTKSRNSEPASDVKNPALRATESDLRGGDDQAGQIVADKSGSAEGHFKSKNVAAVLDARNRQALFPATCRQVLWLSFFFDGTGNNRDADASLDKLSNIARLFRAHRATSADFGISTTYIPGLGTYFPDIGDDGGHPLGLGCGWKGEERLEYALRQFDQFLAAPLARAKAPSNAIQEINIAVFGFSRGAALARAFLTLLMTKRCKFGGDGWRLRSGNWMVRFRFLGLFDTVASVGIPMSVNTTGIYEGSKNDTSGMLLNRLKKYPATRPDALAFAASAAPGADPAPGRADGHDAWAKLLRVHETVEEVRHFVAAHEIRNSFPLDSVSRLEGGRMLKPGHFYETIYPGCHSDVGGGYAPGEGARGSSPPENLALIPLRHMYNYALRRGVPMRAEWSPENKADFDTDSTMSEAYNAYQTAAGSFTSLGDGLNKHMALLYAWRMRAIRRQRGSRDAVIIDQQAKKFQAQDAALKREMAPLAVADTIARMSLETLKEMHGASELESDGGVATRVRSVSDAGLAHAEARSAAARDALLTTKARKDALPDMRRYQELLNMYDARLMADIEAIRPVFPKRGRAPDMANLRPHYKLLIEAYENEFEHNRGLKDETIISFFDNYVHDSLAGFGKDATLPSDPRVVYVGGDVKHLYASKDAQATKANPLSGDDTFLG